MTVPPIPDPGTIVPRSRRLPGAVDPLALYAELADRGRRPHTFLLESAHRTTRTGERSLVGIGSALRLSADRSATRLEPLSPNGVAALAWLADRYPAAEMVGTALRIPIPPVDEAPRERDRFKRPSPLDVLRAVVFAPKPAEAPNPWCHLAAGIFGYDAIDYFETLPPGGPDPLDQPLLEFWIPDQLVVIDHLRGTTTAIATGWGGPGFGERIDAADDALRSLVGAIERAASPASGDVAPSEAGIECDAAAVDQDDAEYAEVVSQLQREIAAGNVYQIVASRTFSVPCPDPLAAYRILRARNPSPYLFYLAGPDRTVFGASPETCLSVDGPTRRATILPIAGSAPRPRDPAGAIDVEADVRAEVALRLDPKELAEHMMLVDLARNDLARITEPGTRSVTRLLAIERYAHVMHLVSEVSGRLAPDIDALEAYAATMNMGTLVGAPKLRAAELLRETEPSRRGGYGGGIGYLRHDGTLETAITIRAAVVSGGIGYVRAGAGIVLDSDPDREAEETRTKARAVLQACLEAAPAPAVDCSDDSLVSSTV